MNSVFPKKRTRGWRNSSSMESRPTIFFHQEWDKFLLGNPDHSASEIALAGTVDQKAANTLLRLTHKRRYTADKNGDTWLNNPEGDCEDKCISMRWQLHEKQNIPLGALSLTLVQNRRKNDHCVLCLRTEDGDYILDPETSIILPWTLRSDLNFLFRQSVGRKWERLYLRAKTA